MTYNVKLLSTSGYITRKMLIRLAGGGPIPTKATIILPAPRVVVRFFVGGNSITAERIVACILRFDLCVDVSRLSTRKRNSVAIRFK